MVRHLTLVAATAFLCSQGLHAQEPRNADQGGPTVFKSESDLVVLHVNVFDGRSDAVPDLPKEAFTVLEDGQRQDITFFNSADVPVAVGLVLDSSSSMITRLPMVIAGGKAFARSSHPEDELFTLHFNEHLRFGLPSGVPFTSDQTLLATALQRYGAGGRTAFYDAVIAGIDHLQFASHQKRVLVVLSDGEDNASRHSQDEMIERARASNAIIYTVSNANRGTGEAGDARVLRRLASVTGGEAYFPDNDEEVVQSFDTIAGNIRRGYLIGYTPTNAVHDGSYRRVRVGVRVPGQKNLRVRSRDGYRAHNHSGSN